MIRPLASDQTNAARGCMHQDSVAGFNRISTAQQILASHALQHHGCTGNVIDVGRKSCDAIGRKHTGFGIRAQWWRGICYPVADHQIINAGANCIDFRGSTIIEGEGHWIQQEAPEAVNAALLTFLTSLD